MNLPLLHHPITKSLFFALLPLAYYLTGALNYAQAGKAGLLGFLVLTPLFYWQQERPANHYLRPAIIFSVVIMLAFMIFQASLREIFGVEQDSIVVIEALFNTNVAESQEFFIQYRYPLMKHMSLLLVLTILYLWLTLKWLNQPLARQKQSIMLTTWAFTFLAVLVHFNPTLRKANPLFFFPVFYMEWAEEVALTKDLTAQIERVAQAGFDSLWLNDASETRTLVWVIGESDTRHNWGLYGYARHTTPMLSARKNELLIFSNTRSADAGTVGSITKMLTPASLSNPELWKNQPDILAMAKHVGYKTFWLSNHATDERGVMSIFAQHADSTVFTNAGTARGEGTFDDALFAPLEQALADPAPRKLIIVHIMGEHPAYNFRYPASFARYDGVFDDAVASKLSDAGRAFYAIAFRNQYDNAVLYHDMILDGLLSRTQQSKTPAAWLYIADHGQDVSHHNDFSGHNRQAVEMWEVPMLAWLSPNFFAASAPVPVDSAYAADQINHTVLGLLHIRGHYYQEQFDVFGLAHAR